MKTEAMGAFESKRRAAHGAAGERSPGATWLLLPAACVASCTLLPPVPGDGAEPRDAAGDGRISETGAADQGRAPEAEETRALGSACASPPESASGHCVNGVCCSAAVCPMCEACGGAGACTPVPSGTVCATANASASACDGQGSCGETQCAPGYLDCDGNPSGGCETAIGLANCGACGLLCSPENVTVAVCSAPGAVCTYAACSSGYLDCDGDMSSGCETPVSVSNCGACGSICQPAHVVAAECSASGVCGYTSCEPFETGGSHYLDCDGNTANGCESNPSAASTCGSCATQCGAAYTCDQASPGVYSCFHE